MKKTTNHDEAWLPAGWISGDEDEPWTPESVEASYDEFKSAGYYTPGGLLTPKASGKPDEQDALDVAHNRRLLRDAWNTHGAVWALAERLTGVPFTVDPFYNPGAQSLDGLQRTLAGHGVIDDGMRTLESTQADLARESFVSATDAAELAVLRERVAALEAAGAAPGFPLNWRGDLEQGTAAAAVNGPHSCTEEWLRCTLAYSREEIVAAFVPDAGDGWFYNVAMQFSLVVRLGRVPCSPPRGVKASSPRGASALLVGFPDKLLADVESLAGKLATATKPKERAKLSALLDALLPEPTRRVLQGETIRVPMWLRPKSGTQYAIVQRGGLREGEVVDLGIVD